MSPTSSSTSTWRTLGRVDPRELVPARGELHWALQAPAALGATLAAPEDDFSHTSFSWDPAQHALLGSPSEPQGLRAGLVPAERAIVLVDGNGSRLASLAITGLPLAALHTWLESQAASALGLAQCQLARPAHAMPDHPIADGETFGSTAHAAGSVELARWFANAAQLLAEIASEEPGARPVRLWPHHFDMATLIALDPPGKDPAEARTLGIGLSPGDLYYAEPYFYVSLRPFPSPEHWPALESGAHWRSEGWVGAVLPGSQLVAATNDGPGQEHAARTFLRSALATARELAGERG